MTKKNKILSIFFILGCICIVAIAVIASLVAKGTFTTSPVFCEGVAIDGVAVGGMKKADGRKKVQAHIEKTLSRQITINTSRYCLTFFPRISTSIYFCIPACKCIAGFFRRFRMFRRFRSGLRPVPEGNARKRIMVRGGCVLRSAAQGRAAFRA